MWKRILMLKKAKQLYLGFRFLDHKTGSNYHNKICTYHWEDECVCFVFLLPYFLIFLGRLSQRAITFLAYSLPVKLGGLFFFSFSNHCSIFRLASVACPFCWCCWCLIFTVFVRYTGLATFGDELVSDPKTRRGFNACGRVV